MADVAIGLRDHSGWAVAVAVTADRQVVDRRRLELCDPRLPRQVYHAAADLDPGQAQAMIVEVEACAAEAARRELAGIVDGLGAAGHTVRAVAVPVGTSPVPPDLRAILASHLMLHAAEGELYQEALADAVQAAGLPVVRFVTKSLMTEVAPVLGVPQPEVPRTLAELGSGLGPPWAKDQKEAAAAALLAIERA